MRKNASLMHWTTLDENTVQDDPACLLVLSCATFWNIPEKILRRCDMKKYRFYGQEVIGHARWFTTASGCLRLQLFDVCVLVLSNKLY